MQEYVHETVNHVEEYVRGQVHTQWIENFWSLLKRGLTGTYVAVEPFHLGGYVDEQIFRYSNRATKDNPLNDADRFVLAVPQIAGKRLTYAELTGKEAKAEAFKEAAEVDEEAGTGEAEDLDRFSFFAPATRRFISVFDTLSIVRIASVKRANSGLFGGGFMAIS